jgi:dephospho-CoA kinase
LKRLPLSSAQFYVLAGVGLGPLGLGLLVVHPIAQAALLERLAEVAVILSLFAAGLKLRTPLTDGRWRLPLRLATLSMTATVGLIAAAGVFLLGLPLGAAVLLGAVLAPTDPVLASDVQIDEPDDRDRLRFALTGGIGSGKSAVARFFREQGLAVVDADQLARAVVQPGSPALNEISQRFGGELLKDDGALDRAALGQLVFGDKTARKDLNAIVHPRVQEAAREAFLAAHASGHRIICYEIPLLFETAQEDSFRPVIVVSSSESARIARICQRDGLSKSEAKARIDSQLPLPLKVQKADIVIENDGSLQELEEAALRALLDAKSHLGGAA